MEDEVFIVYEINLVDGGWKVLGYSELAEVAIKAVEYTPENVFRGYYKVPNLMNLKVG